MNAFPAGQITSANAAKTITLIVNGTRHTLSVRPWVSLLDALRDHLDLIGTKKGCDHGQCGACTVLVAGRRINACLTFAIMHDGDGITTIEGLAGDELHPLQAAFVACDAFSVAIARRASSAPPPASCARAAHIRATRSRNS